MKLLKTIALAGITAVLFSCATMSLQSKMKNISVGTPKKEVVNYLGPNYTVVHSFLTPKGEKVEILKYYDNVLVNNSNYEVEFYNDVLVRFTEIPIIPAPAPVACDEDH